MRLILIHMQGQVEWISDALLPVIRDTPPGVAVEVRLYVTGGKERNANNIIDDMESKTRTQGGEKSVLKVLDSPVVCVQQSRPDLDGLIKDKIACAGGDISVNGNYIRFAVDKFNKCLDLQFVEVIQW